MRLSIFILLFLIAPKYFGQIDLAEKEKALNESLLKFRQANTDDDMLSTNVIFKKQMYDFLRLEGAFNYQFKELKTVACLTSSDGLVKIIHWNLEFTDYTYTYFGYILKWDPNEEKCQIIEMVDVTDPYTMKPEGVIDVKNWYGALYYEIHPLEIGSETQYLLLGWDGASTASNFKIIDVLSFKGNAAKLGSPLFKNKNKVLKRVSFEYADKSSMTLKMDTKRERIVFDHLLPESPALNGIYSYYVPDFSYDAYVWTDNIFTYTEDVIATNKENVEKKTYITTLDPKTGKPKKKRVDKQWINPNDQNLENSNAHVARTEDSESNIENNEIKVDEQPKKKWFDRRNPDNLSVTTGKYRKNRRRPPNR